LSDSKNQSDSAPDSKESEPIASDSETPAAKPGSESSAGSRLPMLFRSKKHSAIIIIVLLAGCYFGLTEFQLRRAQAALADRDHERAIVWLERLESFGFKRGETMFLMARANRHLGKLDETRSCLQEALDRGFSPERIQREEILVFAQSGQLVLARPHLEDLLHNPGEDGAEICEAFVNGFMLSYLTDDALKLLEAWEKDFPEDSQPFYVKGRYALHMGDHKGASGEFLKVLKLASHRQDARNELVGCYLELHEYKEAEKELTTLLNADPSDLNARLNWARCLEQTGRTDESQRQYEMVLDADAESEPALLELGRLLIAAGKPQDAAEFAEKLHNKVPNDVDATFLYAQVLRSTGKTDEAQKLFEEVERSRAELTKAFDLIDKLDQSKASVEQRVEIGRLLITNGETQAAISWLMSALQMDAESAGAHELLAKHFEKSNPERAAEHAQRAKDQRAKLAAEKAANRKPFGPSPE
jgi:tetratricopeptide (TPR) repeat protein